MNTTDTFPVPRPQLSVVVSTYNRAPELRRTLETFCGVELPSGVCWELIVVDNNSNDETPAVCRAFEGRLPLRYVFETRQGVSAARNCGVRSAQSELILFTDDDVNVDRSWLSAIYQAAVTHPEAAFFGGRIHPSWEEPPPRWILENASTELVGPLGYFDLGDKDHFLDPSKSMGFFGSNMVFRRNAFAHGTMFREDIGRGASSRTHGEEQQLCMTLFARGKKGYYVAKALVHHRISAKRMTEPYIRAWFNVLGTTFVHLGMVRLKRVVCGVPLSVWYSLVYNNLRYVLTRWTGVPGLWLKPLIKSATAAGIVNELCRRSCNS